MGVLYDHSQGTIPNNSREAIANYVAALWCTADGLGDLDTNCAIVGGIVAAWVGQAGLPADWLARREPLPVWALREER